MKRLLASFLAVFLSGCADKILTEEEIEAFKPGAPIINAGVASNLHEAAQAANQLSYAYFNAASRAQKAQDVASATVILAAASAVAGAVKGVSDTAIANRALGAVGVQQVASRGVSKATIESIYDGAQILNCIGAVATIYQADAALNRDQKATQITLSVIREVRINARKGLTREVAEYSTVLSAFSTVVESGPGEELLLRGNVIEPRLQSPTPLQLETYLTRLGGCVTSKSASQSSSENEKE